MTVRAEQTRRRTRIQRENEERILAAALDVFSSDGFNGATLDRIAREAGMSKPNLLYYFSGKEEMHIALLAQLLDRWLDPLREMNPEGEPLEELRAYIRRKMEMARENPRESRLFANEILRGAPHVAEHLSGPLRALVEEKAAILRRWAEEGRIAAVEPRHLIFAIWAATQHYADFDAQVRLVLDDDSPARFDAAAEAVETLLLNGLRPRNDG